MYKGIMHAKLRSKWKKNSQENKSDRAIFTEITDFLYFPTAMRYCFMLTVIMHIGKPFSNFGLLIYTLPNEPYR